MLLLERLEQLEHTLDHNIVAAGLEGRRTCFVTAFAVCLSGRDITACAVGKAAENGCIKRRTCADTVADLGERFAADTCKCHITDTDGGQEEREGFRTVFKLHDTFCFLVTDSLFYNFAGIVRSFLIGNFYDIYDGVR